MSKQDSSIPLFDPLPDIRAHWDEYNEAVQNVLKHGQFILGPEVQEFEKKAADFLGVRHSIGVNSGTDALVIGMRAAGVTSSHEVITTPFSFFATAESISNLGAKPVFVDIDPATFNIDPAQIEAAITDKTKAILPVHLFGGPAAMEPILEIAQRHNLQIMEDCAQSFGASHKGKQTGSMGDVGAFSFFPTKNLGGFGDGGLITTDDEDIANMCRKLRAHGSIKKYHNEILGYNSRLDTLQAAVLLVKLKYIIQTNKARTEAAKSYNNLLEGIEILRLPKPEKGHVFHQYTIRVGGDKRDELKEFLGAKNIGTGVYYPIPQHMLPVYSNFSLSLDQTKKAADAVLSLPIYPGIPERSIEKVAAAIRAFFA